MPNRRLPLCADSSRLCERALPGPLGAMPDHRHAARRRHRVVGRLASLGLPLLLVLLELRPALPTAAISSKLPGIPHASYSSLEEALAACDVLETCAAVHEEAKQKERARKDPISGKSGSKGYSYAPATYALCSTDSLFLAHWELLPGGRLRAAVHSSAAKPLDPSRVSKEACRILNPQANHTTASATAPALGLMPPSCKAKGASPTDETPTATTADGAPASAYHHRAGGCLERLVTESAARATSDGALCCRDDAHAGHFLDAVRARLGQPEMVRERRTLLRDAAPGHEFPRASPAPSPPLTHPFVHLHAPRQVEHLWDHIDATLATAPNYVRKILSDLVVLHCYHSCDPANVKPQPGVLTLAASGGAGKGGGRTGGLRDVLADACAQGPQSWKWSARYAFVASSWSGESDVVASDRVGASVRFGSTSHISLAQQRCHPCHLRIPTPSNPSYCTPTQSSTLSSLPRAATAIGWPAASTPSAADSRRWGPSATDAVDSWRIHAAEVMAAEVVTVTVVVVVAMVVEAVVVVVAVYERATGT